MTHVARTPGGDGPGTESMNYEKIANIAEIRMKRKGTMQLAFGSGPEIGGKRTSPSATRTMPGRFRCFLTGSIHLRSAAGPCMVPLEIRDTSCCE